MELGRENVLGLISRRCGVTYPSPDEVPMRLQVPTGDWKTDRHKRALNASTTWRFRGFNL